MPIAAQSRPARFINHAHDAPLTNINADCGHVAWHDGQNCRDHTEPNMPRLRVISIEQDVYQNTLPQWAEALSTHVGRVSPSLRDQEVVHCFPRSIEKFSGRIEYGLLGETVLARLGARPNHFSRSLRTATPTLPRPVLLLVQVSGSARLTQRNRSCTLYSADWSLS